MMVADQVFSQAELLAGELDVSGRELLRLLCSAAVNTLSTQLREDVTPEQCREDFVAAASLYALGQWYQGRAGGEIQEFQAGDLTVKRGQSNSQLSPESLTRQALGLLRPYLRDSFCFQGV